MNWAMVVVGVIFVINSFDSLIRLYTDNMNMSVERVGKAKYLLGNIIVLSVLTVAFKSQWLQISWVGTVVIGLYVGCVIYIITKFGREVMAINSMPERRSA